MLGAEPHSSSKVLFALSLKQLRTNFHGFYISLMGVVTLDEVYCFEHIRELIAVLFWPASNMPCKFKLLSQ